jgi:hypothetical protein
MNMLYEAIKERGSMVIVPSSAVETMAGRDAGHSIAGQQTKPSNVIRLRQKE